MFKRRLDSSSSESKIAKKSKTRGSSCNIEKETSSTSGSFKPRSPHASRRNSNIRKSNSSSKVSKRPNTITTYFQSNRPVETSETKLTIEKRIEDQRGNGANGITGSDNYCPKCQMPLKSLDRKEFEHVALCIDQVIEYKGPCQKGLSCKEESSKHFELYSHDLLAKHRSTKGYVQSSGIRESYCTQVNDDVDDNMDTDIEKESNKTICNQEVNNKINDHICSDDDDKILANLVNSENMKSEAQSKSETFPSNPGANTEIDENICSDCSDADANDNLQPNLVNSDNMETAVKDESEKNDENICDDDDNDDEILASLVSDVNIQTDNKNDNDHSISLKTEEPKNDEYFCSGDNSEDDQTLANLINSGHSEPVATKYSLSQNKYNSVNVIDRDIAEDKKSRDQSSVSNKWPSRNPKNPPKAAQADIGTYFGLEALRRPVNQGDTQSRTRQNTMSNTCNDGFDGVTTDIGGIVNSSGKKCPFYKKIPDTPFVVDAFQYGTIPGIKGYFLSHYHSDHYQGLTKKFSHPIFCSKVTANLVKSKMEVNPEFVKELPMNVPSPVEKVQVTLLEANHCPGSVLFLFELPTGEKYLHTGDFRASPSMEEYRLLRNKHINTLFLDTTYCNPHYIFPSQDDCVDFAVRKSLQAKQKNPKTLIVCGTYTIGKEKVFLAIAEALNCKVSVTREKKMILDCLDSKRVSDSITLDWNAGGVHVLRMHDLNKPKILQGHLKKYSNSFNEMLVFKPTGWEHDYNNSLDQIKPKRAGPVTIYGVPYSEHSNYKELERFVKFIEPDKVVPTVNVRNKKQTGIINGWLSKKIY